MTKIKTPKTTEGEKFYYLGHTKATVDDNGNSVDSLLEEAGNEINNINANTGINDYPEFDNTKYYNAEDIVIKDGLLYKFNVNHYPGDWNQNEITQTSIEKKLINELAELNTYKSTGIDLSLLDIHGSSISRSTANCYVVRETGEYCFPLVYGNAIKNGATNTEAYTKVEGDYSHDFVNHLDNVITDPYIANNTGCVPYKAELSMADTDGVFNSIEVIDKDGTKYIRFLVNRIPSTGANSIISVLDADGVVMWSWHIWVWSDDLTPVTITNSTGVDYDILPVNLGSKWDSDSKDKIKNWYYQFGRPTPMLCPSAYNSNADHTNYGTKTFTKTASEASSYGVGIQNPQIFYAYGGNSYNNWFGTSSYYNLWDASCINTGNSDNTVIKTIYDPCPVGYHMPNGNTFTGFSYSNVVGSFANGYYFKKNSSDTTGVFFPASGYRLGSSGSLSNVGSCGYVWLRSATSANYAYFLGFHSSSVYPQNTNYRAYGFSVRPVREEL